MYVILLPLPHRTLMHLNLRNTLEERTISKSVGALYLINVNLDVVPQQIYGLQLVILYVPSLSELRCRKFACREADYQTIGDAQGLVEELHHQARDLGIVHQPYHTVSALPTANHPIHSCIQETSRRAVPLISTQEPCRESADRSSKCPPSRCHLAVRQH